MVAPAAGPPCATCGAPLRWFAERGSWGCERCLAPSPYAPGAGGAAPAYSPFRTPPPPEHQAAVEQQQIYAAAPGGKRVWFAMGGGVALLVVVAIVFALAGGSGARGGASSRDELIERTLRALADHDVDALVALADPGGLMARVVDCEDKPKDGDEDRDPDTAIRKARERYDKLVRDLPEVTLELVDVRDDKGGDSKPLIDKGDKMMKGCVARMAVYLREATAVVKVARRGKSGREQKIELSMIEADGRFYLSDPPKLDISDSGDMIDKMAEYKDKMCACRDKPCADSVNDEFTRWGAAMASSARPSKPDADDTKRIADITKDYADCYMKLVSLGDLPDAGVASDLLAEPPADMSSECVEYHRLVVRYLRCDGYPQSSRDSVKSTWEAMVQLWPQATTTTRSSMSDTCRDSARVLKQGLDTLCP